MNNPVISVIVPVYNVEKYIKKCVKSIIDQTYKNLEILLVDDGSMDHSGLICDEFAEIDERIRVIHKKNGGLADARNAALDVFTGEYVTCIDSDDYVSNDYIEYLYSLMISNDADVSMCQLKKIFTEADRLDMVDEKTQKMDSATAIENYLYQRCFTASAHCKLYKRAIFDHLRYPVGYYYEDMAIICMILDRSSKIVVSNQQKYYYIQRNDSIMGESFNPKKMHRIEIAEDIHGFITSKYPQLTRAAEARCFLAAVQTLREVPFKDQYESYVNRIWDVIIRYRHGVMIDIRAKQSLRIIALCSYLGIKALKELGRIYTKFAK